MNIREIKPNEMTLLSDFLYEAIFQRDADNPLPRIVIQIPSLWIYIDSFGQSKGDHCLVAEVDSFIVGAVWVRNIHAFGYVSEGVPELAISVYSQYRGKGIGTMLLQEMTIFLRDKGYEHISLSVQRDNPAVRLYQRLGFNVLREDGDELILWLDIL
ncbi:MAG: GNAT family N-acetyltransferase [Prevotellaceae bacterium]|nr:GNAT family N-acetyltransferase [Prevotellaceae bacterium]